MRTVQNRPEFIPFYIVDEQSFESNELCTRSAYIK